MVGGATVVVAGAGILEELLGRVGEPHGAQSPEGSPVLAGKEDDLTTSIAVAIWRAHNSNLVLQMGRRSDIDEQQGDTISIGD
jgi:hypothetical protein